VAPPVLVLVRDASFNILGQIEDFQQLTLTLLYNDVGSWELVMPADSAGAKLLDRATNPGGGIVVLRNGVQLLSGPARGHRWSRSGETGNGVFTVVGLDDAWQLAAHLIWPDPAHAITAQANVWWSTNASNIGTSQPAETIMNNLVSAQMGPAVANSRGISNLVMEGNLARGYSQLVPKGWRYNTVLDGLQQMSVLAKNPSTGTVKDELGFRMRQLPNLTLHQLGFSCYAPTDRSATVRFSFNVGNLAEAEYSTTAPKATLLITGAGQQADTGSGVQINKQTFGWTRSDTYYPGMYAEGFQDQSEVDPLDANASAQLLQGVNDYWESNAGQIAASFKAIDTTTMAFGTHYGLGDFVTVELPQLTFVERVRSIGLAYSPENGEELSLAVGTADGAYARMTGGKASAAMFQRYRANAIAADNARKAHAAHLAHLAHLKHLKVLAAAKAKKAKQARIAAAKKRAKR
jgi:hypothetical protein